MADVRLTGRDSSSGAQREFQSGDTIAGMGAVVAHASTHITGGSDVIANAVASVASGLMSGADKAKLDGIEALADVTDETNVLAALTASGAAKDMGGGNITNVGSVDGRDVSTDGSKLDGIEALADVTDQANVDAALLTTLTANDDLLYRAAGVISRLPKGAVNTVLGVNAAGAFGYKADPSNIITYEWWVDYTLGNDSTGDGTRGAPYKSLQKAIDAAHAIDEAASTNYAHTIHLSAEDYTNGGAVLTPTYIGATAGTSWTDNGDTITWINVTIIGGACGYYNQGTLFSDGDAPTILGPVVMGDSGSIVTFIDCEMGADIVSTPKRPALAVISGFAHLIRCNIGSPYAANGVEALWIALWENPSGTPFAAATAGEVYLIQQETNISCYSEDTNAVRSGNSPGWTGSWWGQDSSILHGGNAGNIDLPATNIVGDSLNISWDNFKNSAEYSYPSARITQAVSISFKDCYFQSARPDAGGPPPATPYNYVLELQAALAIEMNGNHFQDVNHPLDNTAGNNAVFFDFSDVSFQPIVYWGNNISWDVVGVGGNSQEAFHNSNREKFLNKIFYTTRVVNRQMWVVGVNAGTLGEFLCVDPLITLNSAESTLSMDPSHQGLIAPWVNTLDLHVAGNGGSHGIAAAAHREQLPISITLFSGGYYEEQGRVPVATTPGAGNFPAGTNSMVSLVWLKDQISSTIDFASLDIINKSATDSQVYRVIIPGAHLAWLEELVP